MVAFGAGFVWAAGVASCKNIDTNQKEHVMAALTEEDVLAGVREELAQLKVPGAAEATMETEWRDLDIDSLELVELVTALEDRFDVKIADGELKSIAGVGDAVRLTLSLANEPRLGVSVAVTGRGVVTSLGEGADAFFDALAAGASGIVDGLSRRSGFDPERYMDPRVARRTDRYAQFAVAAADQAATEADARRDATPTASRSSSAPASAA